MGNHSEGEHTAPKRGRNQMFSGRFRPAKIDDETVDDTVDGPAKSPASPWLKPYLVAGDWNVAGL